MKKQEAKKKEEEEKKKKEAEQKKFEDTYGGTCYDLFALYDELHRPQDGAKKWYEKIDLRATHSFASLERWKPIRAAGRRTCLAIGR